MKQRSWLKYGLLGGVAGIVCMLTLYFTGKEVMFNWAPISVLAVAIVSIVAAVIEKKHNNGYISFGSAVGVSFVSFIFGIVFYTVAYLVFILAIDKSLLGTYKNLSIQDKTEQYKEGRLKRDVYENDKGTISESGASSLIGGGIVSVPIFGVAGFIVFLISSAVLKREN
jgi:hypothetical protein